MKISSFSFLLFMISYAIFYSCKNDVNKTDLPYHDKDIVFSPDIHHIDSINQVFDKIGSIKFGGIREGQYKWMRQDKNLLLFHNSLKRVGYKNLLSYKEYNTPIKFSFSKDIEWSGMSYKQIIDSLIYYKSNNIKRENYYTKFWKRRKKENNSRTLYVILKDIQKEYRNSNSIYESNDENKNLLFKLLKANFKLIKENNEASFNSYFKTLIESELCLSAYLLINEKHYDNLIQNKDSLIDLIPKDYSLKTTTSKPKWIEYYKDNGP